MKKLVYSFVIVSVVLLALFTVSQLSTARNKSEANTEAENQKGLQKTNLIQTQSSDNIWTQFTGDSFAKGQSSDPTSPLFAQFVQQGPKLVGTGAVGNAGQGRSVSISADGNTAIVGGPSGNKFSCRSRDRHLILT